MPMESLHSDGMITLSVHLQEIPILQIEIHGDKANPNADKPKMHLLTCWALAYTSITYCILVKARSG